MSTHILDNREIRELQPAHGPWQLYAPEDAPYRFQAKTEAEAQTWQTNTRTALNDLIGFQTLPANDRQPEIIETVDKGDYIREKILLYTTPHSARAVTALTANGRMTFWRNTFLRRRSNLRYCSFVHIRIAEAAHPPKSPPGRG